MDRHDDPRSTDELITVALGAADEDDESEASKQGWDAISSLHFHASRDVLEAARKLCMSDDVNHRRVGADILGQLGVPDRSFPTECLDILLGLLDDEDLKVLYSACIALGHLHRPEAIEPLIKLKNHPDSRLRYAVTFGLLAHEDKRAIQALIELSQDEDDEVRDWATFGLGSQIDTDTPEIREALVKRLGDSYIDTLGEAAVGLARRKDERVLPLLLQELAHDDMENLILDATREFADPRLYKPLLDLRRRWIAMGQIKDAEGLESVIAACAPQDITE